MNKTDIDGTLKWSLDNGKRKTELEREHELMKAEVKRAFEKHEKEMQEMDKRGKWIERLVYFIFFLAFIIMICVVFVGLVVTSPAFIDGLAKLLGL